MQVVLTGQLWQDSVVCGEQDGQVSRMNVYRLLVPIKIMYSLQTI